MLLNKQALHLCLPRGRCPGRARGGGGGARLRRLEWDLGEIKGQEPGQIPALTASPAGSAPNPSLYTPPTHTVPLPPSCRDPGALAPCPLPEQGTGDPYLDPPRLHICGPHLAPLPPIHGGPSSRDRAPQEITPGVKQLLWDSRRPWTPTLHQRPERGVETLTNVK